eukprot:CAMPEP_0194374930 /NCGR_PEP_ID=MMETSP0174-20130528/23388_1 /TAXON_ID=216777 /ORGANISM="Proboscia alata, Strain PI-D3" /LENGTH=467 /DNA_ID=CAMNT_0039154807 /DNA_START=39 /DNA_END=1442 /DNA_ORIENTATION=+
MKVTGRRSNHDYFLITLTLAVTAPYWYKGNGKALFSCSAYHPTLYKNDASRFILTRAGTPPIDEQDKQRRSKDFRVNDTFDSWKKSELPISRSSFISFSLATAASLCIKPKVSQARDDDNEALKDIPPIRKHGKRQLNLEQEQYAGQSSMLLGKGKGSDAATNTLMESFSGFVAGGTISTVKTIVKYPLDTATVRLQMPNSSYKITKLLELFDGSYRGISLPLLSNIPGGAIFFAVKDASKSFLNQQTNSPRWLSTCLAVAIGQIPYWLVRNPSEVVKTRQQAKMPGYGEDTSAWDAIRNTMKTPSTETSSSSSSREELGVGDLYLGYWENIYYAYPADVIKFVCYEYLSGGRKSIPPLEGAVYGAVSTALAQFTTTPLDVVRNRLMAGSQTAISLPDEGDSSIGSTTTTPSYLESLTSLYKEEGLRGMFAGASPRVGKAILSGAIQFATYEETKTSIAKLFAGKSR